VVGIATRHVFYTNPLEGAKHSRGYSEVRTRGSMWNVTFRYPCQLYQSSRG